MSDDTPQAKRVKRNYRDTISVLVGGEEEPYVVHTDVATETSDFFTAATNGNWSESQHKVIKLPEVNPEVFDGYMTWLYNKKQLSMPDYVESVDRSAPAAELDDIATRVYKELIELYALGRYLLDPVLLNTVIDCVISVSERVRIYPSDTEVEMIWQTTPSDCTLKRLVVKYWARWSNVQSWSHPSNQHLPSEFLSLLVKELLISKAEDNGGQIKEPSLADRCEFHEHNDKFPPCPKDTSTRKK